MAGARRARSPAIAVSPLPGVLQRVQEIDEVRLLLDGEADGEALVVEVHHVRQGLGRTVVEVRRACREPAQDRPLELADVGAFSRDLRTAGVGGAEGLS